MQSLRPVMHRALVALRERGEPVRVEELARQLLALASPVDPRLSRRLVSLALERSEASLPERLGPDQLRPGAEAGLAAVPLATADFVVVDLETTGVSPQRSAILEIGAVRVRRLRVGEQFASLVRPSHPVPSAITALTGIDDALVGEAPPAPAVLAGFRRWLARTPGAAFVAHNAGFDHGFVTRDLARHGLAPLTVPVLCTRRLSRRLLPELGRYGLDSLCAHLGISNAARHRALGDALATARALVELLELARARGVESLGALLDLQAAPPARRRRRAVRPKS